MTYAIIAFVLAIAVGVLSSRLFEIANVEKEMRSSYLDGRKALARRISTPGGKD